MHLRIFHRLLLAHLAIAVSAAVARADVFHVSPAGNDRTGDGSNESPWRTIQRACDECSPGDSVMAHQGVYSEQVEINVSGSKEKGWITLMGEAGAVLSGKAFKSGSLIHIENQSYIRILNLELRDNNSKRESYGIMVQGVCAHIEIRKCRALNLRGKSAVAIAVHGTNAATAISHVVIDGNEIAQCDPAPSESLVINGNVTDFQVTNNYVHDVNNIGIDFIGGEKDVVSDVSKVARRGVCRGNRVERARSNYGGGYAAGIYVDGGQEIVIEKNRVSECDLGIEVGAENRGALATKISVKDNILFRNDKAGIVFGGYDAKRGRVTACEFTGNICYHNASGKKAEAELWIQHASGNTVRGNTFWAAADARLISCEPAGVDNILDANRWYSDAGADGAKFHWSGEDEIGFAAYQKASGKDASSTFSKPAFADPEKGNFNSR